MNKKDLRGGWGVVFSVVSNNQTEINMNAPTTTQLINKSIRIMTLEEFEAGPHLKADLIRRGFDGTVWIGKCPKEGRKKAGTALYYRSANGTFMNALE
jgi:folylpolyglutamate synthase/dihydropteroate synthase